MDTLINDCQLGTLSWNQRGSFWHSSLDTSFNMFGEKLPCSFIYQHIDFPDNPFEISDLQRKLFEDINNTSSLAGDIEKCVFHYFKKEVEIRVKWKEIYGKSFEFDAATVLGQFMQNITFYVPSEIADWMPFHCVIWESWDDWGIGVGIDATTFQITRVGVQADFT